MPPYSNDDSVSPRAVFIYRKEGHNLKRLPVRFKWVTNIQEDFARFLEGARLSPGKYLLVPDPDYSTVAFSVEVEILPPVEQRYSVKKTEVVL